MTAHENFAFQNQAGSGNLEGYVIEEDEDAVMRRWSYLDIEKELDDRLGIIDIPETEDPTLLPLIWVLLASSTIHIEVKWPGDLWTNFERMCLAK